MSRNPLAAWRLPLRLAWRDALRHRGRSVLSLVLIALPVLAVTTTDVLAATQSVSSVESLERRLGQAQALVTVQNGITSVEQGADPDVAIGDESGQGDEPRASAEQVDAVLGGARLVELRTDGLKVRTDAGQADAQSLETDLRDPLAAGLVQVTSGRLPSTADEVVVNQALADDGYRVGDRLQVVYDGRGASSLTPRIVGIVRYDAALAYPVAAGPLGSLGASTTTDTSWLVGGGPVPWSAVRSLNALGAVVLSRDVVEHPPPSSQIPASVYQGGRSSEDTQVLALIAIMVLIEVVLLAGPAFAVGARKQQRSLALLAASGGTPRQARRVVLASAVVLGVAASLLGLVGGLGLARLLVPVLQPHSVDAFGPFDVRWLQLLGVAAFGLVAALLAAAVPAYLASRQDVVAVLGGRRGDRAPSRRSPVLGLVLVGLGVAGSVAGARGSGELLIAASAILVVLGMVLLIPLVLAGLGRVSGRLPLALRYAVRDAARHRSRTAPAVAAVAATVAGVVALSIGLTSDQRQQRETYRATLPMGVAMVTGDAGTDWTAVRSVLDRDLPGATVTDQVGLPDNEGDRYVDTEVTLPDQEDPLAFGGSALGATVLVWDGRLPVGLTGLARDEAGLVAQSLANGSSVVFTTSPDLATSSSLRVTRQVFDSQSGDTTSSGTADLPLTVVPVSDRWSGPALILTRADAQQLGATAQTVGLAISGGDITDAQEERARQGIGAVADTASVYVERGFRPDPTAVIVQWLLIGLGAVLMLGGSLTATFLALSDARADLATLAAVGASPRTRRGVAAAYTVVIGLVGAVLGALVGLVPGIAVTYPLTGPADGYGTGPYLDIPWLALLTLVLVLPLLIAAIVGLTARSRLPLVARLD